MKTQQFATTHNEEKISTENGVYTLHFEDADGDFILSISTEDDEIIFEERFSTLEEMFDCLQVRSAEDTFLDTIAHKIG